MSIVVEHFGRTYGTFTAVDDLSFEVSAGEIVGLIGPNGAGKTTTLRSLGGILLPTRGRIRVDGFDLAIDPIAAKRRLAFMPDEPHLNTCGSSRGSTASKTSIAAPRRSSTSSSSKAGNDRCRLNSRAA
jgi:ABC-type Na+ transport system ATPase subunit NatA